MKKNILTLLLLSLLLSSCGSNTGGKAPQSIPSQFESPKSSPSTVTASSSTNTEKIECIAHRHVNGNGTLRSVNGLTLDLKTTSLRANQPVRIELNILNSENKPLRDFAITHTKPLHLILVKKNLDGYLHLHPTVNEDGLWSVETEFPSGGSWQIVADFQSLEGEDYNLGTFIKVTGEDPVFRLPKPVENLKVDDIALSVSGMVSPDEHGMLLITATRNGAPLRLDQYLGANAHLVAVRKDGSYSHMHPHSMRSMDACSSNQMPANDPYASDDASKGVMHFMTEVHGAGLYRFYLQFMSSGKLYTVPFTMEVA